MSTDPQTPTHSPDLVLEGAWSKLSSHAPEPLTQEEAIHVWDLINDMAEQYPNGKRILMLHDRLTRELSKGKRCAVCGRFQHPDCGPYC